MTTEAKSHDIPTVEMTDENPELTDLGNGIRMARRHGRDIRFCHSWRAWLIWDGQRWKRDNAGAIVARAKDVARAIYTEAMVEPDPEKQTKIAKWAIRSQARDRLTAMVALTESEAGIPVQPEDLDRDHWALNLQNGTLDLRTGELRTHRREDMLTRLAPVAWEPAATCPLWDAFLARVLPDPDIRGYVQRLLGYSLVGEVSEHVLAFLFGAGANGKSVFIKTALGLLGDYGLQGAPELLMLKRDGSIPCDVAELAGRRLVATVEIDEGRRLAEGLVKQATGGDRIKARFLHENFFEFEATHTLWLAANHRPVVKGTDDGIWRRIKLIPFTVQIPEDEQDRDLLRKLEAERSGILRWAVEGCLAWQNHGLREPQAVRACTTGYRREQDVLGAFIEECAERDSDYWESTAALYGAYTDWATKAGERPLSKKGFGGELRERGFEDKSGGPRGKERGWLGLRLVHSQEDEDRWQAKAENR